jgi:hypothetical protein
MRTKNASMIAICLLMPSLFGGCSKQENAPAAVSDQSTTVSVAASEKPVAVSVKPSNGAGAAQNFTVKFSQPRGYKHLHQVRLLINSVLNGGMACYVYYELPTKSFILADDGGRDTPRVALGSGKSIQNSQCTVHTHGASAVGRGDDLTVVIPIQFKQSFAGEKQLFLWAVATKTDANTDFVPSGQYTVTK